MSKVKARIAISSGDPAGIGPEIVRKALRDPKIQSLAKFEVFAAPYEGPLGRPSAASGRAALWNVENAAKAVMEGRADALVTAPLSKEAIHLAGSKMPGHTEMLAAMAGLKAEEVGMLLVGGPLRVFLASRHLSLEKAIRLVQAPRLKDAIRLCARGLKQSFKIARPRLALAALNPHAGEAGAFGRQEIEVLTPLVKSFAREKSFRLEGPFPADTVFVKAVQGDYDVVICLYHDQGLIPLKLLAFDCGVNVTLGLPFVRCSPDHGTAYDIAGRGLANPESLKESIRLAVRLARA